MLYIPPGADRNHQKKKSNKSPGDPLFFIIYINKTNASELKMERAGQKEAMN